MPKIVTAGILIREGRVLVTRRAPGEKQEGKWEFPGGKVEHGESDAHCLERELYEELGIMGKTREHFCDSYYSYPNGEILLRCYFYQWTANEMELRVHDRLYWASAEELLEMSFSEADQPVARRLYQYLREEKCLFDS